MVHGGGEATRSSRRPFTRPRSSLGVASGFFIAAFARRRKRALPHFLHVELVEPVADVFLETPPFVGYRGAQPIDRRRRNIAVRFELIENKERDVEFASRTEHTRQPPNATRDLLSLASSPEHRQSRTQATRGHPRLMQRPRVAILRSR
jgi:hypothetical protein